MALDVGSGDLPATNQRLSVEGNPAFRRRGVPVRYRKAIDPALPVLIAGSMFLNFTIGFNAIPGDLAVIAYLGMIFLVAPWMVGTLRVLAPLLIAFYVYTLTGLVALAGDGGLDSASMVAIMRDFMAFAWFLGGFFVAQRSNLSPERLARVLLFFTVLEAVVLGVTFLAYRSGGTFPNPNYAAHFVMVLAVATASLTSQKHVRFIAAACGISAIVTTGSFGLVLGVSTAFLYAVTFVMVGNSGVSGRLIKLGLLVLIAGTLFLALSEQLGLNQLDELNLSSSLNADRFARSGDGRLDLWAAALNAWQGDLLGLGPEGVVNSGVTQSIKGRAVESHSDLVTTVAERGVFGLLSVLVIPFALLRVSNNRVSLPIVLVAVCVAAFFRDTLHYRHMALIVGILVATNHGSLSRETK